MSENPNEVSQKAGKLVTDLAEILTEYLSDPTDEEYDYEAYHD